MNLRWVPGPVDIVAVYEFYVLEAYSHITEYYELFDVADIEFIKFR